ncbi:cell wall metabolism sensor histidine kinase WalK [Lysinibacillus sp. FSL M8-0216]|uniref:histidine kinase n=1 Tax=Lysinibacillus fusiformis TaxID=28031 RepID=A0A1H9KWV3_9BACI|nr:MULTISPECIES: cell wall metabolism sensor histidine kinase WalK [Lysinibacillus]EAZ85344.1 two-component sensor histidine kinase [Bacillus sp. B14905]HAU35086.1 cell wall metabolism sensor histidine kinase WalK [Lysinibacillus sp.]MCG7436727.1 cell wall metabolism sensor histidine kinase WalK [Lysinibacillus fusiformis]MED4077137.1 cell wall metabolism sensor histidine kinase WalK [Lysinibacillus fusiformis]MED4671935.1 cell wall metabolism sensor histidine kinase WalK [Lysinibacillus fusif
MQKVSFFKSIHVKLVLIYILLILLALQIIGIYFARQLEQNLKSNFQDSIFQRVDLMQYSLREEILKERDESMPKLEESLKSIVTEFSTGLRDVSNGDILEIRVIDDRQRILATSELENQNLIGQRSNTDLVRRAISAETLFDIIKLDNKTRNRVWVLANPIRAGAGPDDEIIGVLYIEANIESVFEQMNEINRIFLGGTAMSLVFTIFLGILVARTITQPIADMRKQAQAMAKGNYSRKVRVYGTDEIGQLAVTFNHLTNRLQEAQSTTDAERRKLDSVLSNMTDGVIATDRKGRIILINDPALELLHISRDITLGRPIASVLGIDQEYSFEDLIHMSDAINLNFSTSDAPYILRANFSVIQKETGFINGLITVLHDITEQEKIEMDRREFVSNVSHELRTPLTTMRSYLEALADGAWKDENIAPTFLNVTQTETERMIRLVNDLLQLSRMDSSDYELNKDIVLFNSFFNRIIDRFEMSKSDKVQFARLFPETSFYVEIDTDKVTQVIDNIISNAIKYSPDGGNIRFGFTGQGDMLKVMISDDGMGIPKENVGRIFDRFYRVDRARARSMGGTGLGLAIAREMIEAHGGKIWAESEEGQGTTIFFTLPYDADEFGEAGEWE